MNRQLFVILLALTALAQSVSLAASSRIEASSEHEGPFQAINAFDDDPDTRWASAPGNKTHFLQVDVYQLDECYWRHLWYYPPGKDRPGFYQHVS